MTRDIYIYILFVFVLLSAHIERFSISRMEDFFLFLKYL